MPTGSAHHHICCGSIHLSLGIWLIAFHTILQGTFGLFIIYTSSYVEKKRDLAVDIVFSVANCFFLVLGSKYLYLET